MVVLLCFFLALLTSPFKSKSWRESRECRAPTSADRAAAQGARSRPPHEQRSPVLPAVSLVSVAAQAITIGAEGVPVAWAPALGDPWFSFSPSYGSCVQQHPEGRKRLRQGRLTRSRLTARSRRALFRQQRRESDSP